VNTEFVRVVGGGLAGSEAALVLARMGRTVELWEMRPTVKTGIHETDMLGELVCSNSLGSDALRDARGLLKAELRVLGSPLISIADTCRLPAGKAFAVDRREFGACVTRAVASSPTITVRRSEYITLDPTVPTILATGPLTSDTLLDDLRQVLGRDNLFFYDAIAPSIWADSVNESRVFAGSRGGNESDYVNCPLTQDEYYAFVHALQTAEQHLPELPGEQRFFEACLPVEEMARRGDDVLRYGPMRPVGLAGRPRDCYAVLQLRSENAGRTVFGLVGFQTSLSISEQRRVLMMIPALHDVRFVRYGLIHRNAFLRGPSVLTPELALAACPRTYVAGQLAGVDGYVESIALGLVAALNVEAVLRGVARPQFETDTMVGLLVSYVTTERDDFQPSNANFGLLPTERTGKQHSPDREEFARRSLACVSQIAAGVSEWTTRA
jgi:methylenetetrahydrofolate--tRNA-(uracil-5-)-methyltransferase